ncbi:uncharacterized protein LOC143347260 [Colletes latitarsis]|uniref:uncharacterized protein LOC143347260 n=1 Tax=Colletes latitarsis TaxID=2605962 RepID=UPI004036B780
MNIEGKVALVTGGANGIGFCTARKLLRNGAKAVALLDLTDSGGGSAAADLNDEFGKDRATFIACDVSKNEQLKESFKKVIDAYKTLDIVLNIAGIMDDADWEIMVDVNYKGIVYGTILGLHSMGKYKGGNGGTIVNMSSVAGLEGIPIAPIYGGTQYAIVGFTQSLKHYYEKTGVRMLTICPGLTTTAMAARFMSTKEHAMDLLDEEMAALAMTTMQKQPPEHVASAIIQLIEKGENGAIFVSENNQAPYSIEVPGYANLKVTRLVPQIFVSWCIDAMSMDNIKNKSAVITGAARGLGYAFAQILLQNGARVVAILDLTSSPGQASAATLEKEFGKGRAVFFPCDVSNREQFKETFRRVVNAFKGVDIFINNAGVYDELNWERTLRINVGGVIQGSLMAIDHMGKHKGGKGGIVVNISSLAGLLNLPISPVYSSVKQNVISFSQCLQASFETTGVHVMVLCPGLTETTITDDASMKSFDFIDFASWMEKLNAASHQKQSVGNVARALVTLIQKGENGAVWVTENEQPPYGIDFPPISTVDLHLFDFVSQNMENVTDKTVLITGAAIGIGYSIAQKLLQNGAKAVAVVDLSTSSGLTSASNLEKEFGKGKATFFPCDVTDTKQFEETFKEVVKAFQGVDIVINNAGIFNDRAWEQTIDLNVRGVVQGSLLAVDHMGKHKGGKGGVVVNIASIIGLSIFPGCPVYCASKHAVVAFSRSLQEHHHKTGVRVLVLCPGFTNTTLLATYQTKMLDFVSNTDVQKLVTDHPLQSVENVANALVSLVQKGQNGAVWVSEGGEPPYDVEFPPVKKVNH